jgi:hypothetical protein
MLNYFFESDKLTGLTGRYPRQLPIKEMPTTAQSTKSFKGDSLHKENFNSKCWVLRAQLCRT